LILAIFHISFFNDLNQIGIVLQSLKIGYKGNSCNAAVVIVILKTIYLASEAKKYSTSFSGPTVWYSVSEKDLWVAGAKIPRLSSRERIKRADKHTKF